MISIPAVVLCIPHTLFSANHTQWFACLTGEPRKFDPTFRGPIHNRQPYYTSHLQFFLNIWLHELILYEKHAIIRDNHLGCMPFLYPAPSYCILANTITQLQTFLNRPHPLVGIFWLLILSLSFSQSSIDFAHYISFLVHPSLCADRLIICRAVLIESKAEGRRLSTLYHTDQWPLVMSVAGVSPMTHITNRPDTPKPMQSRYHLIYQSAAR